MEKSRTKTKIDIPNTYLDSGIKCLCHRQQIDAMEKASTYVNNKNCSFVLVGHIV